MPSKLDTYYDMYCCYNYNNVLGLIIMTPLNEKLKSGWPGKTYFSLGMEKQGKTASPSLCFSPPLPGLSRGASKQQISGALGSRLL